MKIQIYLITVVAALRKAILADVDGWQSDHYYDRRTFVSKEVAA